MFMPDMAKAIADGEALHAQVHPEDAARHVDGVIANQCLMVTLGFAEGYYIRGFKRPVPVRDASDSRTLRRQLHYDFDAT